jgi:subtilisin family serine protease
MNGALVEADATALNKIRNLSFVKPFDSLEKLEGQNVKNEKLPESQKEPVKSVPQRRAANPAPDLYGFSRNQLVMLGVDQMHRSNFAGQGLQIAVLDGGFYNADKIPSLRHLFLNNQILGTYDFVDAEQSVYEDEPHGMQVLSVVAGKQDSELVGPAYQASYWLLRTEEDFSEYRIEEVNWLVGAEFADSVGADIINSSLGYNTFDDPSMDYRKADLDGNTALITRAADRAAATGMLVVVSAGNEGDNSWGTLTAPADGDSVLSVAAVNGAGLYANLSSRGPSADHRIKPNLAAQGQGTVLSRSDGSVGTSSGTSYSAPLITGLAAGLWQAFPQLNAWEVMDYLHRSASQSNKPDSLLGYGIPTYPNAARLIDIERGNGKQMIMLAENPVTKAELILYLNIQYLGQPLSLQFFDVLGRKIYSLSITQPLLENKIVLNPALFPGGLYVLRASSSTWQTESKFVVL